MRTSDCGLRNAGFAETGRNVSPVPPSEGSSPSPSSLSSSGLQPDPNATLRPISIRRMLPMTSNTLRARYPRKRMDHPPHTPLVSSKKQPHPPHGIRTIMSCPNPVQPFTRWTFIRRTPLVTNYTLRAPPPAHPPLVSSKKRDNRTPRLRKPQAGRATTIPSTDCPFGPATLRRPGNRGPHCHCPVPGTRSA